MGAERTEIKQGFTLNRLLTEGACDILNSGVRPLVLLSQVGSLGSKTERSLEAIARDLGKDARDGWRKKRSVTVFRMLMSGFYEAPKIVAIFAALVFVVESAKGKFCDSSKYAMGSLWSKRSIMRRTPSDTVPTRRA